tara:strand:- start:199 stop:414 length:216 start_codon:yes stop_codon:yes gene_type:complete
MSRLFNEFIQRVFEGNPYAYEQELSNQINAEQEQFYYERKKWLDGEITLFNGGTVEQWVSLGRPKNNNAAL